MHFVRDMSTRFLAVLLFAGIAAMGCDSGEPVDDRPVDGIGTIPYDLDRPAASFELPPELLEISGISLLPAGRIAAVQDEEGTVFILEPGTGAVVETRAFGEAGDYEDVALAGNVLFVLRADGALFELANWTSGLPTVSEIESGLRPRNDPEGLAYDATHNRLLIACKGNPGRDLDEDAVRTVYAFDLTTRVLVDEPALVMDRDTVDAAVRGGGRFAPSAVAIHPETDEVYVLSSDLRAIAVYRRDGTLRAARPLSRDLFEQPEGLLFLPDGSMMISSEGVDGPGMIHRFDR